MTGRKLDLTRFVTTIVHLNVLADLNQLVIVIEI